MSAAQVGQDGGQQDAGQAQESQGGFDPGQLTEQLSGLQQGMEELRSYIGGAQDQQSEGDPQGLDPNTLRQLGIDPAVLQQQQAPGLDDYLDPASADYDPQAAVQGIQQMLEQRDQRLMQQFEERINPLQQGYRTLNQTLEAERLVGELPELADEQIARQVTTATRQFVETNGFPAELADHPQMWRVIHMASKAAELAARQEQQQANPAFLEGSGTGRPAQGEDPVAAIVNARKGASVLPFG